MTRSGQLAVLIWLAAAANAAAQVVINVPPDPAPTETTGDTTVNVLSGGALANSFDANEGSTVNVQGGSVGHYLDLFSGATLNLHSGSVGAWVDANDGSTVNIYGGFVHDSFQARSGSVVNIEGGEVDHFFHAHPGSTVNIRGGELGIAFEAHGDAVVNLDGGSLEAFSDIYDQVVLNINGGVFRHGGGIAPGLGLHAHSGTTVNLTAGGGSVFDMEEDVDFNMSGGWVGSVAVPNASEFSFSGGEVNGGMTLLAGGVARMSGGGANLGVEIASGGSLSLSGGSIGQYSQVDPGGLLTISGYDFRLDGAPIANLDTPGAEAPFDAPTGSVLSGVLADGSAFAFDLRSGADKIAAGALTLARRETPSLPTLVEVTTPTPDFYGVGAGREVRLLPGGELRRGFTAGVGSVIDVQGGQVGGGFDAVGAHVVQTGGLIGAGAELLTGATLELRGGAVEGSIGVRAGSTVVMSGGSIGQNGNARIEVSSGGAFLLTGGTLGDDVDVAAGAEFQVHGAGFRINGQPVEGLEAEGATTGVTVPPDALFTGVLADGSPFSFWSSDDFRDTVTLQRVTPPPAEPTTFESPGQEPPTGLRGGQTLVLSPGGSAPNSFIAAHGSTVRVEGGVMGGNFEALGAEVTVSSGRVEGVFDALDATHVTIDGGEVTGVNVAYGSTLLLSAGAITGRMVASHDSHVTIAGGTNISGVGDDGMQAQSGATIEILGGAVGNWVSADAGGLVRIAGGTVGRTVRGGSRAVWSRNESRVVMTGGVVQAYDFIAGVDSQAWLLGGEVQQQLAVDPGGRSTMLGGLVGGLRAAGVAALHGGRVAGPTQVSAGGELRVFGIEFLVDGAPVPGLDAMGDSVTLNTFTGQLLQAVLSDGTQYELTLDPSTPPSGDWVADGAAVRLTLAGLSGDYNADGVVDAADYTAWRDAVGSQGAGLPTDGDMNGAVDQDDYLVWRNNYGASLAELLSGAAAPVPEPAAAALLALVITLGGSRRGRASRRVAMAMLAIPAAP
ncbi:hypothetical protein KOR34_39920 [Posidoniimonas corsicana]|uniref:Lipoprotein n=1 Tax=Posidoniimonas corsicana TaxID=1938618 RepID=A0A5C5V2M2_9BACT|nr:hypothetical protein [Posidoniimonas corsicana]TWT32230.1 hypothetical protein KOR34_39920 [Posidoniimonas corsicana]